MKSSIISAFVGILAVGVWTASLSAQPKAEAERLDARAKEINQLAKKPGNMKLAYQTVSTETGIPVERLQELHKAHEDIGPAGLMISGVLADNTKKTAAQFIEAHEQGKSWTEIAHNNKVPVDKLNERLDRLAKSLEAAVPQRKR
ncbi:MAG TPA: hypothetical protein VLT36_15305 [Candidatus Dormibacteraeota bacterium]|nr:hypothetical protein [Candidatus Dormibacteraeota bacterium]